MDLMYRCPGCKERYFERKPRDSKGDCKLCQSSIKKHKILIMSAENDMDPFPYGYPDDFPMLTPIETMLISPAYPFMTVYTFANGTTGFRGQILNVQVRQSAISKVLNFLKAHHSLYKDMEINKPLLESFPDDPDGGSIVDLL
jgi:hypothetical protein